MNNRIAVLCGATALGFSRSLIPAAAVAGPAEWLGKSSAPQGANTAELKAAKEDYAVNCATCHGRNGDGKGDVAESLSVLPRDHTDAAYMSGRTDDQLFKAIRDGGASVGKAEDMPPHSAVLSDEAIHRLVKYLRSLCGCAYKG